jgi:hypothetical protein
VGRNDRRVKTNVKVKISHYRLGRALRAIGVRGFHISRRWAHEGDKVVSPTLRVARRHL